MLLMLGVHAHNSYSTLFVWLSVTSLLVSFHIIFYYDNNI